MNEKKKTAFRRLNKHKRKREKKKFKKIPATVERKNTSPSLHALPFQQQYIKNLMADDLKKKSKENKIEIKNMTPGI